MSAATRSGGAAKVPVITAHARRRWRERRWVDVDDLNLVAVAAWRHGEKITTRRPQTAVRRYMGIDFVFATGSYHPVLVTLYQRHAPRKVGRRGASLDGGRKEGES